MDRSQEKLNEWDLDSLWKMLEDGRRQVNLEIVSDEMVFLLGNTRSGKSTLRELLCENWKNLHAVGWPPRIVDGNGDEIGDSSGSSCTSVPKLFHVSGSKKLTWVDTPGFCDNRGMFQEITGMHLLNQVANKGKRLKFLIVIPFQAFYEDADKSHRIHPFYAAMQLIRHTSNPEAVGLVIPKVENTPPFDDNTYVKDKIISQLECLKGTDFDECDYLQDQNSKVDIMTVIKSIVKCGNIFIVRRPSKLTEVGSVSIYEMLKDPNDRNVPHYQAVCKEIVAFGESVIHSEKLGNFFVQVGGESKVKLMKLLTTAAKVICENVSAVLNYIEKIVERRALMINVCDEGKQKIEFLLSVSDGLEIVSQFCDICTSSGHEFQSALKVVERLLEIFGSKHSDTFNALERNVRQLTCILDVTNLTPSESLTSGMAVIFLEFKNMLNEMYMVKMNVNQPELQQDLKDWMQTQVRNHIKIIKVLYTRRHNCWGNAAHNSNSLSTHSSLLSNQLENASKFINPESALIFLYKALNLVMTQSVKDHLHQLNWAYQNVMHFPGTSSSQVSIDDPIHCVLLFLNELQNKYNSPQQVYDVQLDIRIKFQSQLSEFFTGLESKLLEDFRADLCVATIPTKIMALKSEMARNAARLKEIDLLSTQCSSKLSYDLESVLDHFLRYENHFDANLAGITENWKYISSCSSDTVLRLWRNDFAEMLENMQHKLEYYKHVEMILKSVSNSYDVQHNMREFLHENEKCDASPAIALCSLVELLHRSGLQIRLSRFTNLLRNHGGDGNIESEVVEKIESAYSPVLVENDNDSNVLIMTNGNLCLSDVIHQKLAISASTNEYFPNVSIIAGGTIFVDQDLITKKGQIYNLFLCASQIRSVGERAIVLKGKTGQEISGAAATGKSWGEDGDCGACGNSGGKGGNICIVTKHLVDLTSLIISSSGGNGGRGQNGGNGHSGVDNESVTYQICQEICYYFRNFDKDCNQICSKTGLKPPSWKKYQLSDAEKERTPSAGITEKVNMRFDILKKIKFVFACAQHITSTEIEICFCEVLVSDAELCPRVKSRIHSSIEKRCVTTDTEVCKVATYLDNEGIHDKIAGRACIFNNGNFWHLLDVLYDKLTYTGEQCSDDIRRLARAAATQMQFLREVIEGTRFKRSYRNRINLKRFSGNISGEGGRGGNGGDGGLMGCPGNITIYPRVPAQAAEKSILRVHGIPGEGGQGGVGGYHGDIAGGYKVERNSNGEHGLHVVDKCAGDCERDGDEEGESEIINNLEHWMTKLNGERKWSYFSLLVSHDWALEKVFTVDIMLDAYLNRNLINGKSAPVLRRHVESEMKVQNWFQNFYRLRVLSPEVSRAIQCVLKCSYCKTIRIQYEMEHCPVILDLERHLANSLKNLDKIEQSNISAALTEHRAKFEEGIQSKIEEKKKLMREMTGAYMQEIQKHFQQQKRKCVQDLNGYIALLKAKATYEKSEQILKLMDRSADMAVRFPNGEGFAARGALKTVSGVISLFFMVLRPTFKTPEALTGNPLYDPKRFRKDTVQAVEKQIEILSKFCSDENVGPELKLTFRKFQVSLHARLQQYRRIIRSKKKGKDLENLFLAWLHKIEESRQEMFEEIKAQRDMAADNDDLRSVLDAMYLHLLMTDTDTELYTKTLESVTKAIKNYFLESSEVKFAKERKALVEGKFVSVIDHVLSMVQSEIGRDVPMGNRKWKMKDMLMELKEYLVTFVKGLPSEKELQLGFKKIEMALEMQAGFWSSIGKCEDSLEMFKIVNSINADTFTDLERTQIPIELKWKVAKIEVLTQAQLLVLEFEKIEKGFLQWAFPFAKNVLLGIDVDILDVRNMLQMGDGNISEHEIRYASQKIRNIIAHFQHIYEKRSAESTPQDEIWCTKQFIMEPGSMPFFEWKSSTDRNMMRALFLGYPVKFVADVKRSSKGIGAVKVNKSIELRFHYSDRQDTEYQFELDKLMKNFDVEMTHSGTSYYRVDSKYYVIRGSPLILLANVEGVGNIEREAKGAGKLTENDTKGKMKDFVLSPYTEWTFRLRLAHPEIHPDPERVFTELAEKFAHCVDIHLVGGGRYIDEECQAWRKYKAIGVDTYYEQVEI